MVLEQLILTKKSRKKEKRRPLRNLTLGGGTGYGSFSLAERTDKRPCDDNLC